MQRNSCIPDNQGSKVIVVKSDDYYSSLSPIRILQPNEKTKSDKRLSALCNRIVYGSKGKDNVASSVSGCDTCRYNRPSSSSHVCGNFPEGSEKPMIKQVNILRKPRTLKSRSKQKRYDNFSIAGVVKDVARRSAESGKIHRRSVITKSKGPKSTSSLVKDAIPEKLKVPFFKLTSSSNATSGDISPTQEGCVNFTKPGLPHGELNKNDHSSKKSGSIKFFKDFPPKETLPSIDVTTSPDPVISSSAEPSPSPTEDVDVKFNDNLDESVVLDLLNQQYGNILETELMFKRELIDLCSTESELPCSNSTYSKSIEEPVMRYEVPWHKPYEIKVEELIDQIETIESIKANNAEAYNTYFNNSVVSSFNNSCTLFTPHELRTLPGKIFNSPVKIKEVNEKPYDTSFSNIPKKILKHFHQVTFDELHDSVEIKKEIISDSDLVDDDVLEVFEVVPSNTSEKRSYAMDPTICVTFESEKNPTNDVLEANCEDALQITTGKPQKLNPTGESAKCSDILQPYCDDTTKNTKDSLLKAALLNCSIVEVSKSPGIVAKETNENQFFSETKTSDYLDKVADNVDTTRYINGSVEMLNHPKTDELETTASIPPSIDNTLIPEVENAQIPKTAPMGPTECFLEDLSISREIAICSEVYESIQTENDILEVVVDAEESLSEKEFVDEDRNTFEEAVVKGVWEKSVGEESLEAIYCDHSYGLNVNRFMGMPESSKPADEIPIEAIPLPENTTGEFYIETDDVFLQEIATLQPVNEEADKEGEENAQQTREDPVEDITEKNKIDEIKKELESENLISFNQDKTNVTQPMTDTEISNLKTRIMNGTLNKEEILEIIEAKNLQYTAVNRNLEQQRFDMKHLAGCLRKQIDVMKNTYEYFDAIIDVAMTDLDANLTETTLRNVRDNLYFIKEMVDKTFAYYDIRKQKEKKVKYKVINVTKKNVPQTQSVPVLSKAPLMANTNVVKKKIVKYSSKLLTRTLYRMNRLLDTLEKRNGVLRTRKQNSFVLKLREMAKRDLSNVVSNCEEGEDLGPEASQDKVVTNNSSDCFEKMKLNANQAEVKPFERRTALRSIENVSDADWDLDFKGFSSAKITPISKEMRVILSQIEDLNKLESKCNKRNTCEEIHRSLLERRTKRISKKKTEKNIHVCKSGTEEDIILESSDRKNHDNLAVSKISKMRGLTVENEMKVKQNDKVDAYRGGSRSQRSSKKPPGFYSEAKMFAQDSSGNETNMLKYQVDCSKLDVSESNVTECTDLMYELKNDDKPCVILYNKKEEMKTPIFENFSSRYDRHKPDVPTATVQSSQVRINRKIDKPKTSGEMKKTDKPKIQDKIEKTDEPKILKEEEKTDEQTTPHRRRGRRNPKQPKVVDAMPRSLRSTTMKERNAVKESQKTS